MLENGLAREMGKTDECASGRAGVERVICDFIMKTGIARAKGFAYSLTTLCNLFGTHGNQVLMLEFAVLLRA